MSGQFNIQKSTAREHKTRMYENLEQFRRYWRIGGEEKKKKKHEALNRIRRKHVFTGLSITVALYSFVENEPAYIYAFLKGSFR